ncbi:hypothetical protein V8C37DRAFT_382458 [Trichoderma ceciliae]
MSTTKRPQASPNLRRPRHAAAEEGCQLTHKGPIRRRARHHHASRRLPLRRLASKHLSSSTTRTASNSVLAPSAAALVLGCLVAWLLAWAPPTTTSSMPSRSLPLLFFLLLPDHDNGRANASLPMTLATGRARSIRTVRWVCLPVMRRVA